MPKTTEETVAVLVKIIEAQLDHRKSYTEWMRKTFEKCCQKPGNTCLPSIVLEEEAIEAERKILAEMTA
jgi:hypothetical protein